MDMRTRRNNSAKNAVDLPDISFESEILEDLMLGWKLVIFNDDVNSFQHVISTLMEILNHSAEQAEQCAWIIHSKGRCVVKEGSYDVLTPFCTAITDRGIDARIVEE